MRRTTDGGERGTHLERYDVSFALPFALFLGLRLRLVFGLVWRRHCAWFRDHGHVAVGVYRGRRGRALARHVRRVGVGMRQPRDTVQ